MYRIDPIPSARPASAPTSTIAKTSMVTRRATSPVCCADCHANADFKPSLQHGVVEHAIEPDAGEQQRNNREEERQHRQQPLADGVLLVQLRLCSDIADAEFGAPPRHRRRIDATRGG